MADLEPPLPSVPFPIFHLDAQLLHPRPMGFFVAFPTTTRRRNAYCGGRRSGRQGRRRLRRDRLSCWTWTPFPIFHLDAQLLHPRPMGFFVAFPRNLRDDSTNSAAERLLRREKKWATRTPTFEERPPIVLDLDKLSPQTSASLSPTSSPSAVSVPPPCSSSRQTGWNG
jgi:hypothetical protein